jgi:hypothetical protein
MKNLLKEVGLMTSVLVLSLIFVARGINVSATVPGNVSLIGLNTSGNGQGGNGNIYVKFLSKDGKYVVFSSAATNLVNSDTNGYIDVFATNVTTGTTQRVSTSTLGVQSNAQNDLSAISETGRYVAFRSLAGTLIDGISDPPYANYENYIHDLKTGATTKITLPGASANIAYIRSISNDGRFVLYTVQTGKVVRYDTQLGTSITFGSSSQIASNPTMSCDGSIVVFESAASTFTAGDSNGVADIFVADMRNGTTYTNITQAANAKSGQPEISCNGNYLSFLSDATNITSGVSGTYSQFYRYDRIANTFDLISQSTSGTEMNSTSVVYTSQRTPGLSDKGDAVFASDATSLVTNHNNRLQSYFRNVSAGTTERLSINSAGTAVLTLTTIIRLLLMVNIQS